MKRMINHKEKMTLQVIRNIVKQSEVFNVQKKSETTRKECEIYEFIVKGFEEEEEIKAA